MNPPITEAPTLFSIQHVPFGNTTEIQIRYEKTGEMVSVLPELGACLNKLVLQKNGTLFELTQCANSPDELAETKRVFRGSFLFPFPNRIKDGKYYHNQQYHQLPINFPDENNAIHGLLLNKTFQVVQEVCSEKEAILGLEYKSSGEEGYPFPFRISIELVLSASKGFGCKTIVHNEGQFELLAALGWHPYFKLGASVDECHISFPAKSELTVDQQMIPTGAKSPDLHYQNFQSLKGLSLDTCFSLEPENMHLTRLFHPGLSTTLHVWQTGGARGYNYLQLYIPADRQSIAIEPMTAAPDAFNNALGVFLMEAGDAYECSFGVYLE